MSQADVDYFAFWARRHHADAKATADPAEASEHECLARGYEVLARKAAQAVKPI